MTDEELEKEIQYHREAIKSINRQLAQNRLENERLKNIQYNMIGISILCLCLVIFVIIVAEWVN